MSNFLCIFFTAELRNDYTRITELINENIEVLHSARLAPTTPSVSRDPSMQ